jgi:serine-type D-Ala-D-Ala carboxypeptidase/endopeptidase
VKTLVLIAIAALASVGHAQVHRGRYVPSNDEIRAILIHRIEDEGQSAGIVLGVVDSSGKRVVSYPDILNGETIFEVGSLTKVFTALLLSDAAQRGQARLSDPVARYVPVKLPDSVTLEALAMHTSGLPRMPSNFTPSGYTHQMLFASLSAFSPPADPEWKYSNLGYGLLGQAIAPDFEQCLRSRITGPLGMDSTHVDLVSEDRLRVARVTKTDFGALAPAAGLHSTANDLLKFLSAALGYTKTPLSPAMAAMLNVRRATSVAGLTNALGWQISMPDGFEIVWKDGETPGYSCFLGYNPKAGVGVVVLSDGSPKRGVNDIGMYILDGASQLFRRVK